MIKNISKLKIFIILIIVPFIFFTNEAIANGYGKIILEASSLKTNSNQTLEIKIYTDTSVPVNAAQVKISYPSDIFKVVFIDTAKSDFYIKAEETLKPDSIKIVRGNLTPLKGKHFFASLKIKALKEGDVTQFQVLSPNTLILTSEDNKNIYSSEVEIVKKENNILISNKKFLVDTISKFFSRIFGE